MAADWDDHRFFLAIAREGSLTAAGRALGVSQPTVSRRLESLESRLKVRLFDRTRHGYQLTAVGTELFDAVQRAEEQLDDAGRKIYGKDQTASGGLRLTCTEIFFNGYLAPFLWRFLSRHPGIDFSVICTDSALSLGRSDADLAIRFARLPPETLVGHRLASVAYAVYADERTAQELRDSRAGPEKWDWIGAVDEVANRLLFNDAYAEGHFKHRVDTVEAMQSMARSGLGITVLPCYVGDRDEGLRRLKPERLLDCGLDLWILHHPDIRSVYRVRLLADFIAGVVKEDQDLFEGRRPL
jgi:DNA-binding transcriptional LysR family regulator